MKIEPGVYALHRAAQTEVSATEFRDDDRGLTVSVGTPADTADLPGGDLRTHQPGTHLQRRRLPAVARCRVHLRHQVGRRLRHRQRIWC